MREVTRPRGARADAAGKPLEVADARQTGAHRRAQLHGVDQLLDRVESPADRRCVEQRVEEPIAQAARAHRRRRLVEHPEEAPAAVAAERLEQLEVPARGAVELQEPRGRVGLRSAQVCGAAAVDRIDVRQRSTGRPRRERRQCTIERRGLGQRSGRPRAVGTTCSADVIGNIPRQEQLARREPLELLARRIPALHLGRPEGTRREVDRGEAITRAVRRERRKQARRRRIEALLLEDRSRRDDADDLALEEPASARLRLLADRDRMARRQQPGDVWLRGVRREPAERDLVGIAAVARRQRQVEDGRRRLGVLEEHLVEVAEPEQQDRGLVLRLDAKVLRDQRARPPLHLRRHGRTAFLPDRPSIAPGRHVRRADASSPRNRRAGTRPGGRAACTARGPC